MRIERLPGGKTGQVRQEFATAAEIAAPSFQRRLRASNANGQDIFISPNTIKADATGRTKDDVDQIRHIYLDLDAGGREAVDKILSAEGMPKPHHVIETSPDRHQVIWQVEGFDKTDAEATLRNLAAAHGGDPAVTDSSRVLRPPGFRNCKYEQPHWVREVPPGAVPERAYGPADFPRYPEVERPAGAARPRTDAGHGTQSHKDFAYAMRKLEHGVDPEVIKSAVARFRSGDKWDAAKYADKTIAKAMARHAAKAHTPAESPPAAREGMER